MTVTHIVLALTFFVTVHAADWGYDDPMNWGKSFPSCNGKAQSPVHIRTSMAKYHDLGKIDLTGYKTKANYDIVNNGHTIQLNIGYPATAKNGGLPGVYRALQFHFHWSHNKQGEGSEHILNNKAYPLEVHIVHMNDAYPNVTEALKHNDGLAVLGFFFEVGNENPAMNKFLNNLPQAGNNAQSGSFSLEEMLGSLDHLDHYYRYLGSLTTPPCSEAVVWTVFGKIITLSSKQLDYFWTVKDSHGHPAKNYRPIQALNGRQIYMSWSSGMMTKAVSVSVFFSSLLSASLW